ncbi:MAG: extracellular solute-binding protein [Anaerolineae bacterium]
MRPRLCLPVLLSLLAVAACGATAPPTATPEPVAVRFVYEQDALSTYFDGLAQEFETAHPGIDIVLEAGNPYSALQPGSEAADVSEVDQLSVAVLADSGLVRPLDPLLQGSPEFDLDAFYEGTVDSLRWRGELWGLPADVDPWVLYYNSDRFDELGVDYPRGDWTWDDLLGAAQELSDPTAASPVYGLLTDMSRADFVSFVYQNGGTLVDSLVSPTTVTFTEPATVDAIEWYVGLSLDQGVSPTPRELRSLGGFAPAVMGGHAAMWYGPLSERGGASWGSEWPFNWGVVAPPGNVAQMTLITMRAYVMSATSTQTAVAWTWMQYLAEHPATTRDVPPLKAVAESDAFRAALREDVASAAAEAMAIGHTIPPATWMDEVAGWLGQALNSVFEEQMGVAEALESVQTRVEQLLAAQGSD